MTLLEPQSTALFILLMVVFCGLLAWVALTRQMVFRVLAASLAFIPAMLFGVAAVNKYYSYYQTWSAVAADFAGQSGGPVQAVGSNVPARRLAAILNKVTVAGSARKTGETVQFKVNGLTSHLNRVVDVYLPPQYFWPGYRKYRFPAIELITGNPGEPQDWINVVGVTKTYLSLLGDKAVKPAVLVMPDANGGQRPSLECLNIPHGPQDARFLVRDVPAYLTQTLRIQPPGPAWGIAGYSEGGYCTANLAINYRSSYGYAGVLSGYFVPDPVKYGKPMRTIYPFRNHPREFRLNTPGLHLRSLPVDASVPRFWLGAGESAAQDVKAARAFQRIVLTRQPGVQLHLVPGGAHTMTTWRALIPGLLEWMTPGLARAAHHLPSGPQVAPAGPAGPLGSGPVIPGPVGSASPAPDAASRLPGVLRPARPASGRAG